MRTQLKSLILTLFASTLITTAGVQPTAHAAPGNGVPFQQLQQRTDELTGAVETLAKQMGGGDQAVIVDCITASINDVLVNASPAGRLTIIVEGSCTEDVTITRDDVTLQGGSGTVDGQITINGARRVFIKNLTVTGSGAGISGIENASFTVENSTIDRNGAAGIEVLEGAHADINNNTITNNGQANLPDSGRGVIVNNAGSATIAANTIQGNRSDGVGVFNGAFARVQDNTIEGNGRPQVFEAGIQVSRAVVRANRNIITNNGYAAIEVFNDGSYRTGTFLNAFDTQDNIGPFEVIEGVGPGKVALDIGQASYVDLRQVHVKGTVFVGRQSMLQVRGDNVLPNQTCSTIEGALSVFGFNSGARLRTTNVTGPTFGLIDGPTTCPPF